MTENLKISAIIPNYNGIDLLKGNMPALVACAKLPANKIVEIIVVDNGSTDESVKYLKNNFPEVVIIKHKENRGFAKAVNMGVRYAKGNILLLINNDVLVSGLFLQAALTHFADTQVFAVSLHEKGFGPATANFDKGLVEHRSLPEVPSTHKTFWVSGGSGLFRKKIWKDLGGLDDRLFSPFYWEDLDICYRAAKRGFKLLWEGGSEVKHNHESTSRLMDQKKVNLIREANELKFVWKNITSKRLINKHYSYLFSRIIRHPGYLRVVFKALSDFSEIKRSRTKERREAKVSDEALFA